MKKFLTLATVAVVALSLTSSAPAATAGQRNALESAKQYLSMQGFSKSGLAKQLEYEGYSKSDARWAVNNVRVSWKRQAVRSAKAYLDMQSFSKSGLISQLEYEGFTHSQAVYGANKAYG